MERVVTVATFDEAGPAEALKERFCEAGLHAVVVDESSLQSIIYMSRPPHAQMRVRVTEEEVPFAKEKMQEWEKEGMLSAAVRCPQCGSSRIEYPQFSRRILGGSFFALLSAAHLIPREYFCQDCQFTWPDHAAREVDRDALNWPLDSKVP